SDTETSKLSPACGGLASAATPKSQTAARTIPLVWFTRLFPYL
ncbi:MAG: hypothetical protein JWP63_5662, partial [Candidatus Solibacter sp.]|nr:hypothetical protein [Candidatus Solibacter sp.]